MSVASPTNTPLAEPWAAVPVASTSDPPLTIWRMSVDRYHRMIDSGLLGEDDHLELLDGVLVDKMPGNPKHQSATDLIADAFRDARPEGHVVRQEAAVTFANSEPEPDVAVVRGKRSDFFDRHPSADECTLLVEVAHSSISRDTYKARLYAAAGVREYWILDLPNRRLIVHRNPSPDGYSETSSGEVAETVVNGTTLRVDVAELP